MRNVLPVLLLLVSACPKSPASQAHTEPTISVSAAPARSRSDACANRTGGALITIEVNKEQFRFWSTNPHFISESHRRMEAKKTGTALFNVVVDGQDCDEHWTFHVEPSNMSWPGLTIEQCDGRPSDIERDKLGWISNVKRWCPWGASVVSVVDKPSPSAVTASTVDSPYVLSGLKTYESDTYINATTLQVDPGTTIALHNGATLTIVASSVSWGDNVTIDATGRSGAQPTGRPPGKGSWTSSARCHGGPFRNCGTAGSAHQAYLDAIEDTKAGRNNDRGEQGYAGGQGGVGGTIRLFLALDSASDTPWKTLLAIGGSGGTGGRGGDGKDLKCGDHGGEHWAMEGPAGPAGASGADGRLELHVTGTNAGLFLTKANDVAKPKPGIAELLSQTDWDAAAAAERAKHSGGAQ